MKFEWLKRNIIKIIKAKKKAIVVDRFLRYL